jgi:hypothetical protein
MNQAPIREAYQDGLVTKGWANWFNQVFNALNGWNSSVTTTATLDFPPVAAQGQQSLTVPLNGARIGDSVQIYVSDTTGIFYTGSIVADNVVTVYAKNFSAGIIDPASSIFRIILLQN